MIEAFDTKLHYCILKEGQSLLGSEDDVDLSRYISAASTLRSTTFLIVRP